MGPWRLELVRLWRTRRLIALGAVFLILGFGLPVLTYYLPDLIKNAGNNNVVQITVPKQTAADGIKGFASNVAQLGTVVVVVVTAASLALDARPGLAAFYRTRILRPRRLLLPRYLVVTAATIVTLALGTLAAWYETTILLGSVPFSALAAGFALEALWFCFVTSVVAAFTGAIRGVLGVVGGAIGLLLAFGLLGNLPALSSWLPTSLSAASAIRFGPHPASDLWQAAVVTVVATVAALCLAIYGLGKREV